MDESPTHDSGIEHSSEFPSSMLTDRNQLDQIRQKLYEGIRETVPDPKRICPGFEGKNVNYAREKMIDCDEVFPGIVLGDGATARNKKYLKKIGITHIVNAAYGKAFGFVSTDEKFYESEKIKFLGLRVMDQPGAKISLHFEKSAAFIEEALESDGKVFVHCVMGVSRSATIVIAFLMIKRGYSAESALRAVRSKRCIIPNEGFLLQLAHLDLKLSERRSLQASESSFVSDSPKKKKPCHLS